ncbi:MAG: branched-chain amino acid ABC transporter permease [Oligoflexales bacterium]|nr:branched-chain amino acid ABC transporter permease [Oligoflexales bacterium]
MPSHENLFAKANSGSISYPTLNPLALWAFGFLLIWLCSDFISSNMNPYYFGILIYSGINITLALSLNLVNGYTGQFSMGHAGFMSVGAYTSAFLSLTLQQKYPQLFTQDSWLLSQLCFFVVLFAGASVAAAVGYLVGLPSLRLKGDYLAIVTLGFGEIIRVVLLNIDAVGGARGLPGIPSVSSFGWVYTVACLCLFVLMRILSSPMGREFVSVREDPLASEAMGVDTTQVKVRAFVIGAFFAGAAGGLFAHYLNYLNPAIFDFNKSFDIIIMVVLGGMGSLTGSVVAAMFLTILKEALRPLQELTQIDFRMVLYSLILILMMILRPDGVMGMREIKDFLKFFRKSKN